MTDVFDRVRVANPVPDPDRYFESLTGKDRQILSSTGDWRNHMAVQEITRLETPEPAPPSRTLRGWRGAVTAAAAVLVLAVGYLAFGGGDEESSSQYADAAAGGDPMAIAGLFSDSFRTGDVDTVVAYLHPDFQPPGIPEDEVGILSAWIEFEGALYGRDNPGSSTCQGPINDGWYFCTYIEPEGSALASVGRSEVTWGSQIVDGLVRALVAPGDILGDSTITNGIHDFFEWPLGEFAKTADSEGSAAACDVLAVVQAQANLYTMGTGVVYNQECGEFLAGFVDEYSASLGD